VEDCECRCELDGLDGHGLGGIAGRSGERVAGGCASGTGLRGNRRWHFCECDERSELDGGWSAAGAGSFGISAERSGDGAATFQLRGHENASGVDVRARYLELRPVGELHERHFQLAANDFPDTDGYFQWHADGGGRIREPGKFKLHRRGARDLRAGSRTDNADGNL